MGGLGMFQVVGLLLLSFFPPFSSSSSKHTRTQELLHFPALHMMLLLRCCSSPRSSWTCASTDESKENKYSQIGVKVERSDGPGIISPVSEKETVEVVMDRG